jgi:hypothetical protein
MKCEEAELVMIDYLDNTVEKSERREIEKHLETCERCRDVLKDFRLILETVESAELEQPGENLRLNFYHMLHGEINKQILEENKPTVKKTSPNRPFPYMSIAAGFALLIAGALIALWLQGILNTGNNEAQLAELRTEVQDMKEMVMLNMLKEESPSQRIQAVNYAEEMLTPDRTVIDALTATLNKDKNVNVRLAAAYSLAKYADSQSVRDSLVTSLSRQTEPIVQVVLINILVEKKETRAIQAIQHIISNEKTLKDVKDVAQKGINVLL